MIVDGQRRRAGAAEVNKSNERKEASVMRETIRLMERDKEKGNE